MDPNDRRRLLTMTAIVLGVVYLAVGVLGFFLTGFEGFADPNRDEYLLGIFEINPLHNVVHLLVGAALLGGGLKDAAAARGVLVLVGVVYLIVGVAGFFLIDTDANILSLNQADNWLHIGTAIVALGVVAAAKADAGTGDRTDTRTGGRGATRR